MVYSENTYGVYIQGLSGKLYTKAAWNGQEIPNGIAVISENCSFVIALAYNSFNLVEYPDDVISLRQYQTSNDAITDFSGRKNTETLLSEITEGDVTLGAIYDYMFPNGKDAYLGSAGEMNIVRMNYDAISSLFNELNSEQASFPNELSFWTSTFHGYRSTGIPEFWAQPCNSNDVVFPYNAHSEFYQLPLTEL